MRGRKRLRKKKLYGTRKRPTKYRLLRDRLVEDIRLFVRNRMMVSSAEEDAVLIAPVFTEVELKGQIMRSLYARYDLII